MSNYPDNMDWRAFDRAYGPHPLDAHPPSRRTETVYALIALADLCGVNADPLDDLLAECIDEDLSAMDDDRRWRDAFIDNLKREFDGSFDRCVAHLRRVAAERVTKQAAA